MSTNIALHQPKRTVESTREKAIMDVRIEKAQRILGQFLDHLGHLSDDDLIWAIVSLDESQWCQFARAIGERQVPSPTTRGVIIGMIVGGSR